MSEAKLMNQCSPSGSASPTSTQRVAKWRARKKRGVLYVLSLEIVDRDLRVLKHCGHLASDDPSVVSRDEVGDALASLLDGLATRLGVFGAGSDTPATGGV
jgi:hypothetical protein